MLKNIGTTELIIILVVVVILFGSQKIPELIKGIALSIQEFRKSFGSDKSNEEQS